jgi:hypothetical protein
MKRSAVLAVLVTALVVAAGAGGVYAQTTFKIPFKFEAGGKKCAAGDYTITAVGDTQLILKQESSGKEVQIAFQKKLAQPVPAIAEPQLVFDEVGNFEPSYTDYFTVYVLAQVWLPGQDGLEVHVTKGAHKSQVIKGQSPSK